MTSRYLLIPSLGCLAPLLTAACARVERIRDSRHETVLERPEAAGAGRRRSRDAPRGDRASRRRVRADRKTLPEAAPGDRRRRAQAGAWTTGQEGRSARGGAAHPGEG